MQLIQIRRGTDAQRTAVTPNAGEMIFTTDTKKLWIGDGLTVGGLLVGGSGASFNSARGTKAIATGVNFIAVTGLALPSVPAQVLVTMRKVTGGLNLFAIVRSDSITTDGFTADLSAATDTTTYQLDYLIIL